MEEDMIDLLIIDEWLLFPISEEDSEILLSIIDRRHNYKATIVASQYEPAEWLDQIPTAVVAEAITDRLASQAYRIIIRGSKSMREDKAGHSEGGRKRVRITDKAKPGAHSCSRS